MNPNIHGIITVKQENTEISYEALTQKFDGHEPNQRMLNELIYEYKVMAATIKARTERTMTESEIRKMAFLYRLSKTLRRMGIKSSETLHLDSLTWLEEEK